MHKVNENYHDTEDAVSDIFTSYAESLLHKDEIRSFWLKIESPITLWCKASSTQTSAVFPGEYGVNAAFDGMIPTFCLDATRI